LARIIKFCVHLKVAFFESLSIFSLKCHKKFIDLTEHADDASFIDDLTKIFESIYIYLHRNLPFNANNTKQDSILFTTKENISLNLDASVSTNPLQNLFESCEFKSLANNSTPIYNYLILLLDEFDTLKYVLMTWAYLKSQPDSTSSSSIHLLKLIDTFFADFILVNKTMNYEFAGLEYLLHRDILTNSILNIMLKEAACVPVSHQKKNTNHSSSILKLSYSLKTLEIFDSLLYNFEQLVENKIGKTNNLLLLYMESVDIMQSLALMLNNESKIYNGLTVNYIIVDFMTAPNGNMSNKYVDCLLNWLECFVGDTNYEKVISNLGEIEDYECDLINGTRCHIINSLTDIFFVLCKLNKNWTLPCLSLMRDVENDYFMKKNRDYDLNVLRLNKYISSLLNSLVSTRLKPSTQTNQSYFIQIEKIKSIKTFIEPCVLHVNCLNASKIMSGSLVKNILAKDLAKYNYKINYLNNLIDLFRINIEKNLNLFFLKHYFNNTPSFLSNSKRYIIFLRF
jgi:hypothetical protein